MKKFKMPQLIRQSIHHNNILLDTIKDHFFVAIFRLLKKLIN